MGTSVELTLLNTSGKEKVVTLERVATEGRTGTSQVPPTGTHTNTHTHSRSSAPLTSEADLFTPQRVYRPEQEDKIAGRTRAKEHPLLRKALGEKTDSESGEKKYSESGKGGHSGGKKGNRAPDSALGKQMVTDLRAALLLMRDIAHQPNAGNVLKKGNDSGNTIDLAKEMAKEVGKAVNMAEESIETAESAHLAAAWLWQEIQKLKTVISMEQGRAHAANERASDAEVRGAHLQQVIANQTC